MSPFTILVTIISILLVLSLFAYIHYLHMSHVRVLSKQTDSYARVLKKLRFSRRALLIFFWILVIILGYHWFRESGVIFQDMG
ncbi:hypothetical protein LMG33818_001424 [Halomonadaceae bacterium LMG 33818]